MLQRCFDLKMLRFRRLLFASKYCYIYEHKLSTKVERIETMFPEKLFNKKHKTPANLYLANQQIADIIHDYIEPYYKESKCETVYEINPGAGFLTKKLLDHGQKLKKIVLVETLEHFIPDLYRLQLLHSDRVRVVHDDFVSIWKLAYQDKMDNGTRVAKLLQDMPKRAYNDDPSALIIGAIGSYKFFKHLINSVIFQNSLLSSGRCEMLLIVPPPIYIHLTCNNDIGYMIYRSSSMLFQMLFEYEFITQVPRGCFLPSQTEFNLSKSGKLNRVKSINPENLYLIKITPRKNFLDLCPVEDLPALWYFVKQNCISRRNRVIPNLEKWSPGCGPRLIINKHKSEPVRLLKADENTQNLPKYSVPCTTMSCTDFYPNMNIYTQFGDLSASQMLTLFTQFRHWPEYSESSFLASLENSFLKMESSAEENIESIDMAEEDDASNEMLNMDINPLNETVKRTRKAIDSK